VTRAEARKAALEARRIVLHICCDADDDEVREAALATAHGFSVLLRQTHEGEAIVFACKR
jgi:hypothetical protein